MYVQVCAGVNTHLYITLLLGADVSKLLALNIRTTILTDSSSTYHGVQLYWYYDPGQSIDRAESYINYCNSDLYKPDYPVCQTKIQE